MQREEMYVPTFMLSSALVSLIPLFGEKFCSIYRNIHLYSTNPGSINTINGVFIEPFPDPNASS